MIGRDEVSAILDPQISYKNLVSILFIILVTKSKWYWNFLEQLSLNEVKIRPLRV